MNDEEFEFPKLDRTKVSFIKLGDDSGDREYWLSRPPEERLHQVEVLRRLNYGDRALGRLQRVLEVGQRPLK